jgi:hypothetical protein
MSENQTMAAVTARQVVVCLLPLVEMHDVTSEKMTGLSTIAH